MNPIPDSKTCIDLLKNTGCSKEVIDHCKAVRDIAVRIARKAGADVKLVEAGALLHDIGRSRTHGIRHVLEGAEIAKKLGLSEKIIRIIETHVGAGIPSDEAKKLGLPEKNFIPETLEEKIICHADNLIEKNKRQNIEIELEKALLKGMQNYATRLVALHKELSSICGIDLNKI
jgi:tRNA (cytidine56-2'-O)-methyltransferase